MGFSDVWMSTRVASHFDSEITRGLECFMPSRIAIAVPAVAKDGGAALDEFDL